MPTGQKRFSSRDSLTGPDISMKHSPPCSVIREGTWVIILLHCVRKPAARDVSDPCLRDFRRKMNFPGAWTVEIFWLVRPLKRGRCGIWKKEKEKKKEKRTVEFSYEASWSLAVTLYDLGHGRGGATELPDHCNIEHDVEVGGRTAM